MKLSRYGPRMVRRGKNCRCVLIPLNYCYIYTYDFKKSSTFRIVEEEVRNSTLDETQHSIIANKLVLIDI